MNLVEAQRVLAELLVDPASLAAWEADHRGFSMSRLRGPGAAMIADLDAGRLRWAARAVQGKRQRADQLHERSHLRKIARDWGTSAEREGDAARHVPGQGDQSQPWSAPVPLGEGVQLGLAYRMGLLAHLWRHLDLVQVWEHTIDGFVHGGDEGLDAMRTFAETTPITLHSVDLSVASMAARERGDHLARVRQLAAVAGVGEISDHLAISRVDDVALHFFVPPWRVEEQLDLVVSNVDFLQHELGVRLVLETIAMVLDPGGELGYAEFANEVVGRTGCGLLLDITNILINEANGLMDAEAVFETLDLSAVAGVHLAGPAASGGVLWDSHQNAVPVVDVEWFRRLLPRMPNCRTVVIERDERLQEGDEILDDLSRVRAARDAVAGKSVPRQSA